MLPTASARPKSLTTITRLRSHRSISAPTGRLRTRYGTNRSAPAMPAAVGESVIARMSRGKITCDAIEPSVETTCPPQRSMKSRFCSNRGGGTMPPQLTKPLGRSLLLHHLVVALEVAVGHDALLLVERARRGRHRQRNADRARHHA